MSQASVKPAIPSLVTSDSAAGIAALAELLSDRRTAVLTGAGLSTDSGIPDYRGPLTQHIVRNPVKHDEFVNLPEARQRYWSRASRGFAAVATAAPNGGHRALTQLEASSHVSGIITQNVDGLHLASGSHTVVELHGSLHRVYCLRCATSYTRDVVQAQVARENPGWLEGPVRASDADGGSGRPNVQVAPDGDAHVAPSAQLDFRAPLCEACGGDLMPDVVFFGGSVPKQRAEDARALVEGADALLVVGSSLTVYSGYRFVRQAEKLGLPIAILSLGPTRGDRHAHLKVDAPLAEVLPQLPQAVS